jgi:hypothetical protein
MRDIGAGLDGIVPSTSRSTDRLSAPVAHHGYCEGMDAPRTAITDAAEAMSDEELETAIAALRDRACELLGAGDADTALGLMRTRFMLVTMLDGRQR